MSPILQQASSGLLSWKQQDSTRGRGNVQGLLSPRLRIDTALLLPHSINQSKSNGQLRFKRRERDSRLERRSL